MSDFLNKQLRSVIEWADPDPDLLFERWTDNGDEIKNASKLIVGPGQGCIFVYEGKVEGVFEQEGSYDLKTDNIPFWTSIRNALYKFESYHKVGIWFYRKADFLNKRWGTPSPVTYNDPQFKFPVGLGVFGNFSFRITKAEEFFRKVVAGASLYPVREIQKVLLSRITQPMCDFLANAQFGYTEIDKHRNEIAVFCTQSSAAIFADLGFVLLDLRIEGTSFDEDTKARIGRIADMSAEAQALNALGIDYVQHQQLQAMRDLARNEGPAHMGMQIGMMLPHTPPSPQAIQPAAGDPIQKLEKLKKMFELGLITEEEYGNRKSEILNSL